MDPGKLAAMPIPVYPATAKLTSWSIHKVIKALLETLDLDALADPLPEEVVRRDGLLGVAEAYRLIHSPETAKDWQRAQERFRYHKRWCSRRPWHAGVRSWLQRKQPPAAG